MGTNVETGTFSILITLLMHRNVLFSSSSTGEEIVTTDPRGIQSETFQDLLGRTIQTVAGHTNGSPAPTIDQTTTTPTTATARRSR